MDRKGTEFYVPPEFWGPKNKTSFEHDVWGIGIILFEMLTGKKPFNGGFNKVQETAQMIIKKPIE